MGLPLIMKRYKKHSTIFTSQSFLNPMWPLWLYYLFAGKYECAVMIYLYFSIVTNYGMFCETSVSSKRDSVKDWVDIEFKSIQMKFLPPDFVTKHEWMLIIG